MTEAGGGSGEEGIGMKRSYPGTSPGLRGGRPLLYGPNAKSSRAAAKKQADATKIYLNRAYVDWQLRKEAFRQYLDKGRYSNADFAEHLLADHTGRCFPNYEVQEVGTQTDPLPSQTHAQGEQLQQSLYSSTPVKLPATKLTRPVSPVAVPSHPPERLLQLGILPEMPPAHNVDVSEEEEEDDKFGDWKEAVADLTAVNRDGLESTLSVEEEVFGGLEEFPKVDELGLDQLVPEQIFQSEPASHLDASNHKDGEQPFGALISSCVHEKKGVVWVQMVVQLLKELHGDTCPQRDCYRQLVYSTRFVGTAFTITWSCSLNHSPGEWSSQPMVRQMFAGNLLVAAGIVLSGNGFLKTEQFFNCINVACISRDTFYRAQRLYVAPVVKEYWEEMQQRLLSAYGENTVVLAGDGRCDSPGHSAQYCCYVFTDEDKKVVLHAEVVDVREAGGKSPNMERIGFERGMNFLTERIDVAEVVTDAHPQVTALMKNSPNYIDVLHQHDVWDGAKELVKKVRSISQTGDSRILQSWIPSIKNHFCFSSKMCDGDDQLLKASFLGILHHVTDEHSWVFRTDGRPGGCSHDPQDAEEHNKRWLEKGSVPHRALAAEITKRRFLQKLPYYKNFRHTGTLENFNNLILMYAPKRHTYSYTGFKLRTHLAMIDHNSHVSRKQLMTAQGAPRYACRFSKNSGRFSAVPVKEKKKYAYMSDLLTGVFMKRMATDGSLEQRVSLSEDDPKRIHPRISMLPKPNTDELVKAQKS